MDKEQGLICSLSGRIADFDPVCPQFKEDTAVMKHQAETQHVAIDIEQRIPDKAYFELEKEQNLTKGILGGIGVGLLGSILWAIITILTKYQIGFMAIGIGYLVGMSVRTFGKGIHRKFGIAAGIIAFLSCIVGNFLSVVGIIGEYQNMDPFDALVRLDYAYLPEIMLADFSIIDILFYGLAISAAYKMAFRVFSELEIAEMHDKEHAVEDVQELT